MGTCLSCCKSSSNVSKRCASALSTATSKQESVARTVVNKENQSLFPSSCSVSHHMQLQNILMRREEEEEVERGPCCDHNLKNESSRQKRFRSFYCSKISSRSSASESVSESKINSLFNKYEDPLNKGLISAEGIEKFCSDMNLAPDEFKVLVLAWKFNAYQMCQFTREEFVGGCKRIQADSIKKIQSKLLEIVSELEKDIDQFKDLYKFTFNFGLDNVAGQRILPVDVAVCLWKVVFAIHQPVILNKWLNFLSNNSYTKGIPKDTWNMFLNFSEFVKDDLSDYDDTEAWPSIFDDFVEYENKKKPNKKCKVQLS